MIDDDSSKLYEDHFLERIQRLNGKDKSWRPRHYTDFEGLPCILVVVEKGKMGITYPKSLRWYDLRVRYFDTSAVTRSAMEQVS